MKLRVASLLGGSLRRLSSVWRWSSMRLIRRQNVAEHSHAVSLIALSVVGDLRRRGIEVDGEAVLAGAICHDVEEAVLGDVRKPVVQRFFPRDELADVSAQIAEGLSREVGVPLTDRWRLHLGACGSIEAKVVRLADELEALAFAVEEYRLGNLYFRGVLKEFKANLMERLDDASPLYDYELEALRFVENVLLGADAPTPGEYELIQTIFGGSDER